MAQVDITTVNGNVILEWVGGENIRKMSFAALSISTAPPKKIYFYEDGGYKTALYYAQINEIDGVAPTTYQDAINKILALLPTAGGGISYNTVTAYDTAGDLPITFPTQTIHAISILCITGTLTVTISGEETTVVAGQKVDMEADTLLEESIVINNTTGTFLVTTIT